MTDPNITDFLEARIAEDEAAAKAATAGPWEWEPETDGWGDCGPNLVTVAKLPPYPDGSQSPVESVIGSWGHDANGISVSPSDAEHIARHDPGRVLAECAAKRAILAMVPDDEGYVKVGAWESCSDSCPPIIAEAAIRTLAAVYRDHPDYRLEWAA